MKFDKSEIYTAVDAEELEEGDVVLVGDALDELQEYAMSNESAKEIKTIRPSTEPCRFETNEGVYILAYLIAKHDDPYKEFKKAQADGKKVWFLYGDGKWHANTFCDFTEPVDRYSLTPPSVTEYKVFLDDHFVFTSREVPEWAKHVYFTSTDMKTAFGWCTEHNKFADVAKAWEEGKQIQYLDDVKGWSDCEPDWNVDLQYRVKPVILKWTDLKCGDVIVKGKDAALVTYIDGNDTDNMHIYAGTWWISDDDLKNWEKVEND